MTSPATTSARDERLARYQRFIDHVHKVCLDDPGRRAALRHSLGKLPEGAGYRAHGVVTRFLPDNPYRAEERAFYAIAAMIAAQPRDARDQDRSDRGDDQDAPPDVQPAEGAEPGDGQPDEESAPDADTTSPVRRVNLGTSLAEAVPKHLAERSAEARLHLLARQGLDGCHRHLPALIRQLRGHQIRIDWVQLLDDLIALDRHRDRVAKQWLQSFYRTLYRRSQAAVADTSTSDTAGDTAP